MKEKGELLQLNTERLTSVAQRALVGARQVIIKRVNEPVEMPWYDKPPTLPLTLPPLTLYPYITRPAYQVQLDAALKGSPLNVYDVLMAMRSLNFDPFRSVAEEVKVFSHAPDLLEIEIEVDTDT